MGVSEIRFGTPPAEQNRGKPGHGGGLFGGLWHPGDMASEITVTLWSDANVDSSVAHSLAKEAAAQLHRSTGLATAVAGFAARHIEPTDVVPVPKKRRRDPLAKAKSARRAS